MSSRARPSTSGRRPGTSNSGRSRPQATAAVAEKTEMKREELGPLLFLYPLILATLFLLAGFGYQYLFRFEIGGVQYRIGAQGYRVKGQDVM